MSAQPKPLFYEFEEFRLDTERRLLLHNGETVTLTPKVLDLLLVLVEGHGGVVSKDRLMQELWSDSFVEEANIAQNVAVLRRALGEKPKENKFIVTVPGRGYRFVAKVTTLSGGSKSESNGTLTGSNQAETSGSLYEFPPRIIHSGAHRVSTLRAVAESLEEERDLKLTNGDGEHRQAIAPPSAGRSRSSTVYITVAAALVVLAIGAALIYEYGNSAMSETAHAPSTLAVLPLKSLDPNDNYLSLGIADAVIRRISQTGMLTVRPTSAVRRYLSEEKDALTAAKELGVDAVLDGTVLRSGDQLRVSVNLLRTSDGRSLWTDNFDMSASDVFAIEDKVAHQIAKSLELRLNQAQQESLAARYKPNAIAYEYYLKGLYSFDQRGFNLEGKPQHEATIGLFKKSIEADPNFPQAHAQLAYAYAWMAVYIDEQAQADWIKLAKEEIARADALDPQLAETHIARHHVLLSADEGYQTEAAVSELLAAKRLDPNAAGVDLSVAYNHLGLEDLFDQEMRRTLDIDPTSEFNKRIFGYQLLYAARYDNWLAFRQKYFDGKPNYEYLLGKNRLDEAAQLVQEQKASEDLDDESIATFEALVSALKEDRRGAEAKIPVLISKLPHKNNSYHHCTYDIARIYASLGNSAEAVKWLKETAVTGFPDFPLFERDHYLDPIREAPEFVQFMADMKAQNDRFRKEFAQ